ncbi:MAG: phosphatidate cytidylyltransferase [Candidatus Ornithospirochaeta sp.]|nr:phosphatidate cytidylyltransferase [Candidatus Ornithospirochaeta sp.]
MKKRIISAILLVAILAISLILDNQYLYQALIALITAGAVFEVMSKTGFVSSFWISAASAVYSAVSVFLIGSSAIMYFWAMIVYTAFLLILSVFGHRAFSFHELAIAEFAVVFIPIAFSTILLMNRESPVIYILLSFASSFVTDTGAFAFGKLFGKHKLAPEISPNKTIEGAIGGVASSCILLPAICYIWNHDFNIINAVIVAVIASIASIVGDLFASGIKRQAGIKDFSNIIPGHGGILDRFDSLLFAAPSLYFIIKLIPIFR